MTNLKRKSVTVDGLQLFYCDTETAGPTILCLHGRFGRGETWLGFMRRYAYDYRIIAPDQRGHGLSDKPWGKYTADEMADDAAALIKHCGAEPAIVVGHSMGGRIGAYLSAMHRSSVSALVVLDQTAAGPVHPSTLSLDEIPEKDAFTADWPMPFSSYTEAREFLLEKTGSTIRTDYYLESLYEQRDGYHMLFSQQATSAIFEYQQDWFHLLPKIVQPVLLVRAKDSVELPRNDCARMEQQLRAVTTVDVTRPEHHVYLSNPNEFYVALDRFLQGLDATG